MIWEEILAAVRWWAILMLLGAAVTPLAFHLFKRLPDRGYAFVKMLGLLITSYLFWILGSFGFLGNNVGGILVALVVVLALSVWAFRHNGDALRAWLSENRLHILLTELLFTLLFGFWVWVRAQNPAITGTEKPMEFAFLNAIGRSPDFPPLDPWLSGYAISYYYFGYVMTSIIARLAAVPEMMAFNLGVAWLFAGTGIGAFGLVYNLIAIQAEKAKQKIQRAALGLGVLAAIALPIGGNFQVVLELLHVNGYGSPDFWAWLDVRNINGPANESDNDSLRFWWWWRSSRVINEYTLANQITDPEPIAEFPSFSFVLGDLHPHVLALPFAFLSLAVAYAWWLNDNAKVQRHKEREKEEEDKEDVQLLFYPDAWGEAEWTVRVRSLLVMIGLPLWGLTVLVLGGLSFLNTWDVLIHLFVVLGAFVLSQWRVWGWHRQLISQTIVVAVLLVIPAILIYLPFYVGFRSQAGAPYLLPMLNRPTRLVHFLILMGIPLLNIVVLLLALGFKQKMKHVGKGVLTAVLLLAGLFFLVFLLGWIIASSAEGFGRVSNLANELGLALPPRPEGNLQFGWGFTAAATVLPAVVRGKLAFPGMTLLLSLIISLVVMIWMKVFGQPATETSPGPDSTTALPFVLLLVLTGALLTLGPEFVYLRDNFGVRINTVFKFYYQAWVMFGLAATVALYYLWQEFGKGIQVVVPYLTTGAYTAVFLLSLLFPYYAIQARANEFRGPAAAENRQPPTLNGLAWMQRFNPDEYDAIMWLREYTTGAPVILEAVGGQYSEYGRVSASTGMPTVLGWAGHELQWRGSDHPEPGARDPAIRDIYRYPTWENTNAANLLNQYGVEYIYVGHLERTTYGTDGRLPGSEKFDERLDIAYQNSSVTIYRWQPN